MSAHNLAWRGMVWRLHEFLRELGHRRLGDHPGDWHGGRFQRLAEYRLYLWFEHNFREGHINDLIIRQDNNPPRVGGAGHAPAQDREIAFQLQYGLHQDFRSRSQRHGQGIVKVRGNALK